MGRQTLNFVELVDGYLHQEGWKVRSNSNSNYSLSELVLHSAGSVLGNYALEKVYTPRIQKAHEEGIIHVHD
ncbi:ribonucleoside triphosphate reductase, partial [Patescibacteria group bacterium]|nr:ribonucleoside triphosphate reductase [Patescibacteria group bacterium]